MVESNRGRPPKPIEEGDCAALQSGFVSGFYSVWRVFGDLPRNFSANSSSNFYFEFFGLVSPGFEAPPPPKNSRP